MTIRKALMLLLITLLLPMNVAAQELYAELSSDKETLTFYYDTNRDSRSGTVYEYKYRNEKATVPHVPMWYAANGTVTKVVFDPSVSAARPSDCSSWFYNFWHLNQIEHLNYLNTQNAENMNAMFYSCNKLISLDLSNFNTQKVKDMGGMFYGCRSLVLLDVSNFNTQKVTSMGSMFSGCESLPSLDVSNFDTQNVTSMGSMFSGCESLVLLDVSNFDTRNVTSMGSMFYDCTSLPSLDVSNFDTQNVTDMGSMFNRCESLTSLDLSNFDTRNVRNMKYMFFYCESLPSLDVSNFDTRNVTSMGGMFNGCESLTSLDVSNFDTQKVKEMGSMFSYCERLTSLDVSNFDTQNVTEMNRMFYNCSKLKVLNLSSFDTQDVQKVSSMFSGCTSLETIYVSDGWNVEGASDTEEMFKDCSKLVGGQGTTYDENHTDGEYAHIDGGPGYPGYLSELLSYVTYNESTLTFYKDPYRDTRPGTTYTLNSGGHTPDWYNDSNNRNVKRVVFDKSFAKARPTTTFGWFVEMSALESITGMKEYLNTSEVENMFGMFFGCSQLKSVDLSNFDTEKVTMTNSMFNGCSSLTSLDLSSFNTASVTDMAYMFASCSNLKTIYVGKDWSTQNAGTSVQMFDGCTKLVGGKGTKYDAEHTDKAYAHVDGGSDNPGYLTQKQMGDVNGDGNVNSADVQKVYALMAQGADGNNHPEADVNGDGNVNSADIQKIYSIMATGK